MAGEKGRNAGERSAGKEGGATGRSTPPAGEAWSVYVVRCGDGSLYTGIATDVQRRLTQHAEGSGARYVRGRGPLELVLVREVGGRGPALRIEQAIKRLPRARKEALVDGDEPLADLIRTVPGTEIITRPPRAGGRNRPGARHRADPRVR